MEVVHIAEAVHLLELGPEVCVQPRGRLFRSGDVGVLDLVGPLRRGGVLVVLCEPGEGLRRVRLGLLDKSVVRFIGLAGGLFGEDILVAVFVADAGVDAEAFGVRAEFLKVFLPAASRDVFLMQDSFVFPEGVLRHEAVPVEVLVDVVYVFFGYG